MPGAVGTCLSFHPSPFRVCVMTGSREAGPAAGCAAGLKEALEPHLSPASIMPAPAPPRPLGPACWGPLCPSHTEFHCLRGTAGAYQ